MALKISICTVEVSFKGRKLGGALPDTLLSNTLECLFIGRRLPTFCALEIGCYCVMSALRSL